MKMKQQIAGLALSLVAGLATVGANAGTQLLWGDTHLHTSTSLDAFFMGNTSLTPDDAFRYARGLPVISPKTKHMIRLQQPLDFLVVSDHAEYLGVAQGLVAGDPRFVSTPEGREFESLVKQGKLKEVFYRFAAAANSGTPMAFFNQPQQRSTTWRGQYEAADRNNFPGKFTALIGWEWSSITNGANLHRVVFMENDAGVASQFIPFSLFDSDRPEDLWQWLQKTADETGANFVAIPHNGNISKGKMFAEVDSDGNPISAAYAKTRSRWEPVYEVTQIKGDGETLGVLSPNDEFAEFETYAHVMDFRDGANTAKEGPGKGDYARTALMRGLEIGDQVGANPYQFGMIGASDSHTGVSKIEEYDFGGKFAEDSYPAGKSKTLNPGVTGYDMSAAGLSAVWAEENTRESIVAAFKRREVYGTTGPRIQLRFFAGWDFSADDASARELAEIGYKKGVPMGGELTAAPSGKSLNFLIRAVKDPMDGNLDRIQVVKGWLDSDGVAHEKVFNVAASAGREIVDNKLAPVGSTVGAMTASYDNSIGAAELTTAWTDPDFKPEQSAFYYVRVLQIPTPRQSTYASVALNEELNPDVPAEIQERAYSSPVWYKP